MQIIEGLCAIYDRVDKEGTSMQDSSFYMILYKNIKKSVDEKIKRKY